MPLIVGTVPSSKMKRVPAVYVTKTYVSKKRAAVDSGASASLPYESKVCLENSDLSASSRFRGVLKRGASTTSITSTGSSIIADFLIRDEFLKLDQSKLPLELFDDKAYERMSPNEWLLTGLEGQSKTTFNAGRDWVWTPCVVVGYNEAKSKFAIRIIKPESLESGDENSSMQRKNTSQTKPPKSGK